ncbi:MAG: hypothetical protein LBJ86_07115 [Spirochaetaceae bacterium]|jgi:hypothetical protein|nr:hypothetical protein [Spirochaetaceae bacterium]
MKKKIAVIGAALFVFASAEAFSFGLGLRGNIGWGSMYGGGILFSANDSTHFGFNYHIGKEGFYLGVTGDYWIFDKPLTSVGKGSLNFYVGPGLYVQLAFPKGGDVDFDFGFGLRIPIGLDLDFRVFDLFLEFAPQLGLSFLPTPSFDGNWFNAAIGARVWLGK